MKTVIIISALVLCVFACQSQDRNNATGKKIGGPCEGCEALYEYGSRSLHTTDTLPDFDSTEPKLRVTGTVYEIDGKTPARDVILYVYHTNRQGLYATRGDEDGWGKRHGYIRGWVKTDETGRYTIYTFRPGAYPNGSEPEHIHMTVKEPGKNEYYIDEVVFQDDPLLTDAEKAGLRKRGGSGLVLPVMEDGISTVNRDIILGMNIPDYE